MAGDKLQLHTKLYAWCQPVRPRLRMAVLCAFMAVLSLNLCVKAQTLPPSDSKSCRWNSTSRTPGIGADGENEKTNLFCNVKEADVQYIICILT